MGSGAPELSPCCERLRAKKSLWLQLWLDEQVLEAVCKVVTDHEEEVLDGELVRIGKMLLQLESVIMGWGNRNLVELLCGLWSSSGIQLIDGRERGIRRAFRVELATSIMAQVVVTGIQ